MRILGTDHGYYKTPAKSLIGRFLELKCGVGVAIAYSVCYSMSFCEVDLASQMLAMTRRRRGRCSVSKIFVYQLPEKCTSYSMVLTNGNQEWDAWLRMFSGGIGILTLSSSF